MSDSNSAVLQQAYELVETGQAEEARRLVESVLESEQANPDAWWIYAHAVEDPVRARQALNELIALDPDYPGAAQLIAVLDEQYPDAADAAAQATPLLLQLAWDGQTEVPEAEDVFRTAPAAAEPEPEFVGEEPGFVSRVPPSTVAAREERKGTPWLLLASAAAALILILVVVLLLTRPGEPAAVDLTGVAGQPTADASTVASGVGVAASTVEATADVLPLENLTAEATELASVGQPATSEPLLPAPTQEMATLPVPVVTLTPVEPTAAVVEEPTALPVEPPTEIAPLVEETVATEPTPAAEPSLDVLPFDDLNQLVTDLAAFSAPPESALTTEETPLGEALVASFCTEDGPQLRDLTRQVMDTVAGRAPALDQAAGGVGVRAVDCATGQTLRLIVVDRASATLFAQGEINREGFESQWLSL